MQAKDELMSLQKETKRTSESAGGERTYELEIAIRELNEKQTMELERKTAIDPLTVVATEDYMTKRS